MNSKLHAVTDAAGRPLRMFLTAGQRSDYIGARALLSDLPEAKHMLADRGYDADWYRVALEDKGITPCIPSRKGRKVPIPYDVDRYKKRHKIENSFARLKDWRRIATRYDRLARNYMAAIALAAIIIEWAKCVPYLGFKPNQSVDCPLQSVSRSGDGASDEQWRAIEPFMPRKPARGALGRLPVRIRSAHNCLQPLQPLVP